MLKQQLNSVLQQLEAALDIISDEHYCSTCNNLDGNSIGAHTRHIIELYQALARGYENGVVDYDQRLRDHEIQSNRRTALNILQVIMQSLPQDNHSITVLAASMHPGEEAQPIGSTYDRELLYQIEHTIHHLALIKVAFNELGICPLPENFGVSPSTMAFRSAHR